MTTILKQHITQEQIETALANFDEQCIHLPQNEYSEIVFDIFTKMGQSTNGFDLSEGQKKVLWKSFNEIGIDIYKNIFTDAQHLKQKPVPETTAPTAPTAQKKPTTHQVKQPLSKRTSFYTPTPEVPVEQELSPPGFQKRELLNNLQAISDAIQNIMKLI